MINKEQQNRVRMIGDAFDTRDLRQALSAFGTGVTVVTTLDADARPVGVTANSFNSVSLEPPIVLWSLRKASPSLPAFDACGRFVINVADAQPGADLAALRQPGPRKNSRRGACARRARLAVLEGCCRRVRVPEPSSAMRSADHILYLGRVQPITTVPGPGLLFCQGRYAQGVEPGAGRGLTLFIPNTGPHEIQHLHDALHPPGRSVTDTLQEDRSRDPGRPPGLQRSLRGRARDGSAEPVTSSLLFLATLIGETQQIKLGSGTLNLPNSHPATVAAQAAMMDHLAKGRFILGISPGGLMSDAEVYGNLRNDRNAMFVECINSVLKIWSSEPPYNIEGKYWNVSVKDTMAVEYGQGVIMKPFQLPHPPIVGTAVAPFSQGVAEMAKRGWTPLSANFLMPEWVKTHWPKYVEGRTAVGAVADPADWRVAKSIFVADDEATARRYALEAGGPYHFYFKQLVRKLVTGGGRGNLFKTNPAMPDSDITPDYVTQRLVLAGTVNSVVDQILAFREQVGDFGNLVYACHDWMDPALGRRSMELFATEVMPRVNAAIAQERTTQSPAQASAT